MVRGSIIRRLSNGGQLQRAVSTSSGTEVDDSGKFVRDMPLGSPLLHSLFARVSDRPTAPAKRRPGRPRKLDAVAADVWHRVTDGAGVVLVDGDPVEVPKALK